MKGILPKVSIILPVYNGAAYIGKSIESCLHQSYTNIELIIVDDGCVDRTPEIVGVYQDSRIKYIKKEKNTGLPRALNTGFAASTGDYLTWTSADNFYSADAIEEMVKVLKANRWVSFVYGGFYLIDKDGKILEKHKIEPPKQLAMHNCVGA